MIPIQWSTEEDPRSDIGPPCNQTTEHGPRSVALQRKQFHGARRWRSVDASATSPRARVAELSEGGPPRVGRPLGGGRWSRGSQQCRVCSKEWSLHRHVAHSHRSCVWWAGWRAGGWAGGQARARSVLHTSAPSWATSSNTAGTICIACTHTAAWRCAARRSRRPGTRMVKPAAHTRHAAIPSATGAHAAALHAAHDKRAAKQ